METRQSNGRRAAPILALVFMLLSAGIVAAGILYYRNYERRYRAEVEHQLAAIADLKTGELVQYRRERLGDASIFLGNGAFARLVRRYFEDPEDTDAREQLLEWIAHYQSHYQYDRVFLLDAQGAQRLSVPETPEPIATVISRHVADILQSGTVTFQDFYRNDYDGQVYLTVLVPLVDDRDGRALGVLGMRVDPNEYLYREKP